MSASPQAASEPDHNTAEREPAARQYAKQLRAFYVHASLFAVGIVIMFAANLVINLSAGTAGEWTAWWAVWALLGWGIGIAVHGLVVWLNRPSFASSAWEQKQVDKLLGR